MNNFFLLICKVLNLWIYCGEGGIRTPGTVSRTAV